MHNPCINFPAQSPKLLDFISSLWKYIHMYNQIKEMWAWPPFVTIIRAARTSGAGGAAAPPVFEIFTKGCPTYFLELSYNRILQNQIPPHQFLKIPPDLLIIGIKPGDIQYVCLKNYIICAMKIWIWNSDQRLKGLH